jgi:hypothetical protein
VEKIELLYSSLKKDKEFFENYKDKFVEIFSKEIKNLKLIDESTLRTIGDRVYLLLFSFNKNPAHELKNFIKKVLETEVDIKPVFSKAFLKLLRDYIDYKIQKNADFENIKNLVDLIDLYLFIIDSAYIEYTKSLESEISKIKEEKVEEERQIIFHGFERILAENKEVQVLDFYQEVPVICKGKIKDIIDKKLVIFELSKCHYKNFYIEKNDVYIKADEIFPKVVKGIVKESDMMKYEIKVINFQFTHLPQERRKYVRVIPKEEIMVEIIKDGEILKGKLRDISIGGLGIYLKDINSLKINDKIRIRFEIGNVRIDHTGEIKYILKENGLYRIGVEFDKDVNVEEIISEYVVKRQFEIIKELRI